MSMNARHHGMAANEYPFQNANNRHSRAWLSSLRLFKGDSVVFDFRETASVNATVCNQHVKADHNGRTKKLCFARRHLAGDLPKPGSRISINDATPLFVSQVRMIDDTTVELLYL